MIPWLVWKSLNGKVSKKLIYMSKLSKRIDICMTPWRTDIILLFINNWKEKKKRKKFMRCNYKLTEKKRSRLNKKNWKNCRKHIRKNKTRKIQISQIQDLEEEETIQMSTQKVPSSLKREVLSNQKLVPQMMVIWCLFLQEDQLMSSDLCTNKRRENSKQLEKHIALKELKIMPTDLQIQAQKTNDLRENWTFKNVLNISSLIL